MSKSATTFGQLTYFSIKQNKIFTRISLVMQHPSKVRTSIWCSYKIPKITKSNSFLVTEALPLAIILIILISVLFINKKALSSFLICKVWLFFKGYPLFPMDFKSDMCARRGKLFHFAVLIHVTQNFLPLAHHVKIELWEYWKTQTNTLINKKTELLIDWTSSSVQSFYSYIRSKEQLIYARNIKTWENIFLKSTFTKG